MLLLDFHYSSLDGATGGFNLLLDINIYYTNKIYD
jgi:hypothetical protein